MKIAGKRETQDEFIMNMMRKTHFLGILTLLFYLKISCCFSQTLESRKLNINGFEYYKSKNYKKAVELFNLAITEDPENYIAHFNLACTYAILTTLDTSCNTSYYAKTIHELERCFEIDSVETRHKVIHDSDFNGIRNEYEYRVLIHNLNFNNPNHLRSFIVDKTYTSSTPGSTYSTIDKLTINEDNSWVYSYHENAKEMLDYWHGEILPDREPPILVEGEKNGTWKLNGYVLSLFDNTDIEFAKYTLRQPDRIGELYYPDPNDMSGDSDVRHYWKCGKCGCQPIEGL